MIVKKLFFSELLKLTMLKAPKTHNVESLVNDQISAQFDSPGMYK